MRKLYLGCTPREWWKTALVFASFMVAAIVFNAASGVALPLTYSPPRTLTVPSVADRPTGAVGLTQCQNPARIGLAALMKVREEAASLVLDARPAVFYNLGHIPGAISFPSRQFAKQFAQLESKLRSNSSRIVIYCASSACTDARMLHDALCESGIKNLVIFEGGWEEWSTHVAR